MTEDEMMKYLREKYGEIGPVKAFGPTAESYSGTAFEGNPTGTTYIAGDMQSPFYSTDNMDNMFGPLTKGISLRPAGYYNTEIEGLSSEQKAAAGKPYLKTNESGDSEWYTPSGAPEFFAGSIAPGHRDGGWWEAKYDSKGKMVGDPYYQLPVKDDSFLKIAAVLAAIVGAPHLLPEAFAASTVGSTAAGAAGLGEMAGTVMAAEGLGGLTAAEAAAAGAGAAGTAGAGTGAGVTASELAMMGYGAELAPLVATPAEVAGTSSFAQGIKSLKDLTDVGKYIDGPRWLQQGATSGFRNILGQALTGNVDLERALRAGITGGIPGFGDLALADLPPEVRDLVKSGVSTAVQGGNLEDVVKNAALGSIEKEVSSAITGTTGSKWAGEIATKTIKQVLTGGKLDPQHITADTLARLAGRAVGAETGNNALGTAASQAVLGAIKGKDLETILKQSAMGALFTPAKKGG